MAIYSCVKTFAAAAIVATPYDQVVSGITDARTGTPFEPEILIFFSTTSELNTLAKGFDIYGSLFNSGIAKGTTDGGSQGNGTALAFGFFKIASGCSLGRYSICTNGPSATFGGSIWDAGSISATAVGSFTISWNLRTDLGFAPVFGVLALGGTDWNIDIAVGTWNQVYSTTAAPVGVLDLVGLGNYTNIFASGVGAGGGPEGIGWANVDGIYGCTSYFVDSNSDGNAQVQLHDRTPVIVNPAVTPPTQDSGQPIVSNWGLTSWTGAGAGGSQGPPGAAKLAFSGNGIVCAAGTFNALASDGSFNLNLGIDPQFIIFASDGAPTSSDPSAIQASLAIGITDRENILGIWTGENSPKFPSPAVMKGANLISDQTLIISATPDGNSTVAKNKMTMTPITDTLGIAHLTFTDTDGTEPNIIWFAIGTEIVIPPSERGGGIYKMVDGRLNDKLYLDFSREDTALFRIPDPNAYTSLIGDE